PTPSSTVDSTSPTPAPTQAAGASPPAFIGNSVLLGDELVTTSLTCVTQCATGAPVDTVSLVASTDLGRTWTRVGALASLFGDIIPTLLSSGGDNLWVVEGHSALVGYSPDGGQHYTTGSLPGSGSVLGLVDGRLWWATPTAVYTVDGSLVARPLSLPRGLTT